MNSNRIPISRKTGMLIAKNVIVMLVLIIVALFSSFSWFTEYAKAFASGVSVESKAPDGLEIAIVAHGDDAPADKDYVEGKITLNAQNCKFLKDLYFTEITGSGKNDEFYKPKLNQSNGVATPDVDADWDEAIPNGHYISFDLYMRSKSEQTIYLQESTSVRPLSTVLTWADGVDGSLYNPTTSGKFSRDAIVGATRLSIVDSSDKKELKMLWIPAPNIRLSDTADSLVDNVFNSEADSYKHNYYEVTADGKSQATAENVVTNSDSNKLYTLGQKKEIANLGGWVGTNGYYTDYITCHFWIEGEDDEARLALTGGKFKLSLELALN